MGRVFLQLCLSVCILGLACGTRAQAPRPERVIASQSAPAGAGNSAVSGSTTPVANVTVPRLMKFSGMLKDGKGEPKTGVAGVTFVIYADQDGGAPLWMETQNVTFGTGGDGPGRYTALLGANSNEGVPLDLFSTPTGSPRGPGQAGQAPNGPGQARWLGIEGADLQETPRVLLVSVPYALKAADAETLGGMPASAFALANPQKGSTSGASQSGTGTEATTSAGASSPTSQPKLTTATMVATGTASASTANLLAKYDASNNLVPSAIFESGGNVGIGTTNPLAPLHVNGNTLLVQSGTTAQTQVSGAATSGRFGQDGLGTFMASDTSGSSLRFLTNNGTLNEWMRIGSTGSVNIGSAQAAKFGEAVFARDNLDTVHSVIGQAGTQYHFRLSRAAPDLYGFRDFLITPYIYGMAIEYPGTLEVWSGNFSVHMNPRCPVSSLCGPGANLWVGDEIDSGGLYVTALDNGGGTSSNVTLAADRFAAHASHGSMNFVVRNTTDAFKFEVAPCGSEVMKGKISGTASGSSLDLFSGTVQATIRAQSGSTGGVGLGSTSNNALSLFTNNGTAQVTLFPSGNLSIGNSSDAAPLAVGTAGQFQVSSAGAATIGGGTAITRHISVSTSLAFPQFSLGSCNALSVTATGAADGDSVALGIPNALAAVNGLTWFGWVSAPGIVSVRGCNVTNQTVAAPPATNVRVDVWQH